MLYSHPVYTETPWNCGNNCQALLLPCSQFAQSSHLPWVHTVITSSHQVCLDHLDHQTSIKYWALPRQGDIPIVLGWYDHVILKSVIPTYITRSYLKIKKKNSILSLKINCYVTHPYLSVQNSLSSSFSLWSIWSHWGPFSDFSHCRGQIPAKKQFKGWKVYFATQFSVYSPQC